MDVRLTWTKATLIVVGCAIGGLGIGYLAAAIALDKIMRR